MKRLIKAVDRFKNQKILVIGDLILDKYIYASTSRVSREAPVLVLDENKVKFDLGGAGNTINNLISLGADVSVASIIGNDHEGNKIKALLTEKNIDCMNLAIRNNFNTPLKTRVLAGQDNTRKQQVFRLDRGKPYSNQKNDLIKLISNNINKFDAVIISDYGYSIFSPKDLEFINKKINKLPPVFLDSRFQICNYKNVTAATPNENEVFSCFPEKDKKDISIKNAGNKIIKKINSQTLLITRGSKGMMLFKKNKKPFLIPIFGSKNIVDVTGAGDTVISIFTLGWLALNDFILSAILANTGGAITVMKSGTSPVSKKELIDGIKRFKNIISDTIKKHNKKA